ncbi:MAG: DUF4192 domain-containing protein [Actinomycetes bacterium]
MAVVSESSKVMLRSPGAFAAAIPALVGFHPSHSLVAVYLGKGQAIVSMRLDLPEKLEEVAEYVASTGTNVDAEEVILVVCTVNDGEELPHREGIAAIITACSSASVTVKDAMLIDDDRYWSYLCSDTDCCPPGGTPIGSEDCVLDAERVGLGLPVVAVSRDAVVQRYLPRPDLAPRSEIRKDAESILLAPLGERAKQVWDDTRMLAANADVVGDPVSNLMRSRVQVAMEDVRVRDFVMASMALTEEPAEALVDVIVQAALTAPEDLRPRVAGAAAFLLAAFGESSIATVCLLELAEGQSLAELVRVSVNSAVSPTAMRDVLRSSMPIIEEQLAAATPKPQRRRG